MSLTVNNRPAFEIFALSETFARLLPTKHKQEILASKADQKKYAPKGDEWFDIKNKNPGQVG